MAPPSRSGRSWSLRPGGSLVTDGFTSLVLALSGQFKASDSRPGTVGVILLPDEETVLRAFEEDGRYHFPLEVRAATVAAASPFFASSQEKLTIAFPRDRVFFYNTTDRSVAVNLHAYLTN
jgi:hypothetical protein